VGTAVCRIDAVSKAKDGLGKAVVILKGRLDHGAVDCFGDIDGGAVTDFPVPVKVADEAVNPTLKIEGLFQVLFFIVQAQLQLLIEIGYFPQALAEGVKIVADPVEYPFIGEEGNRGAGIIGFSDHGYLCLGYPLAVALFVEPPVALDIDLEPGGEGVYY
jgi:hypothetical protein